MRYSLITTYSLLVCAMVTASPGHAAAAKCGDRAALVKTLEKRYQEIPIGIGVAQDSTSAFEIYVSKKGTWTIVMTRADGVSCVMAVGHSWSDDKPDYTVFDDRS